MPGAFEKCGLIGITFALAAIAACESSSNESSPVVVPDGGLIDSGTGDAGGGTVDPADPTPDELSTRGACAPVVGAGTSHSGTIAADETWTAAASPHHVTFDLDIKAKVTIEPCAQVIVDKPYRITVGGTTEAGSLIAHGTSEIVNGVRVVHPINFDAADGSSWGQIVVQPKATLDLSIVALQNAGGDTNNYRGALVVLGDAGGTNDAPIVQSTTLDRVLIEKSKSYGLNLLSWGALTAASNKLWIRGSGSTELPSAILIEPGVASTLPKNLVATGNVKDEILMQTSKGFSRTDTLVNRNLPYRMKGALNVNPSADGAPVKLGIEAGVTLGFDADVGSGMYIGSSDARQGILEAVGTAAAPIVFTSAKATKVAGDWTSLYFKSTPATGSKISYAKIEYAGADNTTTGFGCGPSDNDGAIFSNGTGPDSIGPAASFIDHTTFENIAGGTVIVSGWVDDAGPNFTADNTFGANVPACHVSKPRRTGAGDVCDADRTTCW